MQINLIFFLSKFSKGGAGNSIFRLSKSLSKKKYKISIICLNKCAYFKEFNKNNVKVYEIKSTKTLFAMPKVLKITKLIISKKSKKNIFISNIHYTNILSLFFLRNITNLKILLIERTALSELNTYFNSIDFLKKQIIKILVYLMYDLSDKIVSNSKYISKEFRSKYKLNSYTIFPPSLTNLKKVRKNHFDKNKKLIIVTVCRLSKEKGLNILFKALANLNFNNYKLLIAGEGPEKDKLKILSKELGISQNIEYLGFVKDIGKVLKKSHLYINSSFFEGFPNSVVEAINYQLPVICSQSNGGINDILLSGKCGTIFENGNSDELKNEIERFYKNPKNFFLKAKLAKQNIKKFTIKRNLIEFEKLFNNI